MTGRGAALAERWICSALVGFTLVLPLAVWPGAARAFSTIKLQLLGFVVPAALVAAAGLRLLGRPRLPLAMDIGLIVSMASVATSSIAGSSLALSSLALTVLGFGWFWALMSFQPDVSRLLRALALSGGAMAAIALLQAGGFDPFLALGWRSQAFAAPRMRLFSTLGNPNFVAAFLSGVLPAQISIAATERSGQKKGLTLAAAIAAGLSILAIALTGSRAASLGLGAAVAWSVGLYVRSKRQFTVNVPRASVRTAVGVAVVLGLVAVAGSIARNPRPLGRAIEGRLYIWRVAAGHLGEYVGVGLGPGSFVEVFSSWEAADWAAGRFEPAARPFAGPQDHAHNEYLELLVEQGIAGPIGLLTILLAFFVFAARHLKMPANLGASAAGVMALAGVAMVDFPLHRPAEWFLFWTLVAAGFLSDQRRMEDV